MNDTLEGMIAVFVGLSFGALAAIIVSLFIKL